MEGVEEILDWIGLDSLILIMLVRDVGSRGIVTRYIHDDCTRELSDDPCKALFMELLNNRSLFWKRSSDLIDMRSSTYLACCTRSVQS